MGVPMQIWQPSFHTTPFDETFARDLQRAMGAWRGEDLAWLIPRTKEVRWVADHETITMSEYMVRTEELDKVSIYHVDEARHIYPPPGLPEDWKNTLPVGLYRRWLQTLPDVYRGAASMKMQLPVVEGEEIVYKMATLKLAPDPIVPFTNFTPSVREGTLGRLTMTWPPPDSDEPAPVSIEMESRRFYGQLRWETRVIDGRTIEVVVLERDPEMLGMNLWFRWPEPFNHFFPSGGGHDLWMHQATMLEYIQELGSGHYDAVFKKTESMVNRLTGETQSFLMRAWFLPKLVAMDEQGLLADIEGKFGLEAEMLDEPRGRSDFDDILYAPIPVKWAQGWLGYFWWEFYQDLKNRVTLRLCKQCGSVISGGHTDRQYCTRDENAQCVQERNSIRQRKRRGNA